MSMSITTIPGTPPQKVSSFFIGDGKDLCFPAVENLHLHHSHPIETLSEFAKRIQDPNNQVEGKENLRESYVDAFRSEKEALCMRISSCEGKLTENSTANNWSYEQLLYETLGDFAKIVEPELPSSSFKTSPVGVFLEANIHEISEGMELLEREYHSSFLSQVSLLGDLENFLEKKMKALDLLDIKDKGILKIFEMDKEELTRLIAICDKVKKHVMKDLKVLQDQLVDINEWNNELNSKEGDVKVQNVFNDDRIYLKKDSPDTAHNKEVIRAFYRKYNDLVHNHIQYFNSFLARIAEGKSIAKDCIQLLDHTLLAREVVLNQIGKSSSQ